MPRYNLRTLRGERVIKKKEGVRLKRWELNYKRLIKDARNVLSLEEVVEEIAQTFENNAVDQEKVSLICPLTKTRIGVPARYRTCRHLQCFDLKSFLAMKTKINFLNCPICNIVVDNELDGLCVDKYFQNILSNVSSGTEIEILGDGIFRVPPSHSAPIIPKVIDDEEPCVPDHSTTLTYEVKSETVNDVDDVEEMGTVSRINIDSEANAGGVKAHNLHFLDTSIASDTNQSARLTSTKSVRNIGEKRHKCGHCSYASNYSSHFLNHRRTHTGEKPFKCDKCSYACAKSSDLKRHMRSHTGEKPFKCSQCSFASTQAIHLKFHIRTHSGEKPYKCTQCSFASAYANALKLHVRTHSGEKPYKCNQCSFACVGSSDLKSHMRTHTGEKPYKCSQCSYTCAQSCALNKHMRTHI